MKCPNCLRKMKKSYTHYFCQHLNCGLNEIELDCNRYTFTFQDTYQLWGGNHYQPYLWLYKRTHNRWSRVIALSEWMPVSDHFQAIELLERIKIMEHFQ